MYTNTSATLFLAAADYRPTVIPHVFFSTRDLIAFGDSGMTKTKESYILFKGHTDLTFTDGKDFVLEGVHDDIVSALGFDPEDDEAVWGEDERNAALRAIRDAGALLITSAVYMNAGSRSVRHWEITCR